MTRFEPATVSAGADQRMIPWLLAQNTERRCRHGRLGKYPQAISRFRVCRGDSAITIFSAGCPRGAIHQSRLTPGQNDNEERKPMKHGILASAVAACCCLGFDS